MRPSVYALACASALSLSETTLAQEFQVNLFDDQFDGVCDAHCSLRDAVSAHNQLGGTNRILLPAGTYALSLPPEYGSDREVLDEDQNLNGDLDVLSGSLTLVGGGAVRTLIDADFIDRIFEVESGAALELNDLTLRNAQATSGGGGIANRGQLVIRRSHLRALWNWVQSPLGESRGGAIYNEGTLDISDSLFENNIAANVWDDAVAAYGGAIFNTGKLNVRDTLFRGNTANSVEHAAAGGTLFNTGEASLARVAILDSRAYPGTDVSGQAVHNAVYGVLTLSNATVSGTSGSIASAGSVLANGSYTDWLYYSPRMKLLHVTIAGNNGAGVHNFGILDVRNSLIVDNRAGNCFDDGRGMKSSGLLLGLDSSNCLAGLYVDNQAIYNKVLYALKDNGAGLPTFSLPPASPALDAGVGTCPLTDQRRYRRPADGDGDGVANCDIGAYERGARN